MQWGEKRDEEKGVSQRAEERGGGEKIGIAGGRM
jgi:hypothetical protein